MVNSNVERKGSSSAQSVEQLLSSQDQSGTKREKKLRMACDNCHSSKIRCCGGMPCNSCTRIQVECVRSTSRRQGRPKGSRKKKNTEKEATESNSLQEDVEHSSSHVLSFDMDQSGLSTEKNATGCSTVSQSLAADIMENMPLFSPSYESNTFFDIFLSDSPKSMTVANAAACSATLYGANDMVQSLEGWQADMGKPKQEQSLEKGKRHYNSPTLGHPDEIDICSGDTGSDMMAEFSSSKATQDGGQGQLCNCLQWLAKMLANLKALSRETSSIQQMDSVLQCTRKAIHVWKHLQCTRKAIHVWKHLLECEQCRDNNAEEVLYLSISGIRIALHNLDTNFSLHEADGDGGAYLSMTSSTGESEEAKSSNTCSGEYMGSLLNQTVNTGWPLNSSIHGSSASLDKLPLSTGMASASAPPSSSSSSAPTAPFMFDKVYPWWMSSYQMDTEEQQTAGRILAMRMIRAIQEVLQALGEWLWSLKAMSLSTSSPSESLFQQASSHTGIGGGLHGNDASQQLAMAFGDSSMHLQQLLESTIMASDTLMVRLRNISIQQLERL